MAVRLIRLMTAGVLGIRSPCPRPAPSWYRRAAGSLNPANEELLKLPRRSGRKSWRARSAEWCIGTEAFLMGVIGAGPGRGNAYWSLRCADGTEWAIQIDPQAGVTAIGCDEFKEAAPGKECFKKF